MKTIESVMQFKGYRVLHAQFSINNHSPEQQERIPLNPRFKQKIARVNDDSYSLVLGVQIGSLGNDGPLPFYVDVEMEGLFVLHDENNAQELMETNATAILFPYLRSALTMLTSVANVNPIILPTINLVKMFEEKHMAGNK